MTRAVIALAIRSGIPASTWLAEPPRYIETALDLLDDENRHDVARDSGGPQMSG
jgi:hypothetical protein